MGEFQAAIFQRFSKVRIHQLVDVELHFVPRIGGYVKNTRVHSDRVFRAGFHAVPTENADSQINVESDRIFFDVWVWVLSGHNGDALSRTDRLTEHAPHTTRGIVFTKGKPMAASEP